MQTKSNNKIKNQSSRRNDDWFVTVEKGLNVPMGFNTLLYSPLFFSSAFCWVDCAVFFFLLPLAINLGKYFSVKKSLKKERKSPKWQVIKINVESQKKTKDGVIRRFEMTIVVVFPVQ